MSNRDNWEIAPRGTEQRIKELEKKIEDAFVSGWCARDVLEPSENMKRYAENEGDGWFQAWQETKH